MARRLTPNARAFSDEMRATMLDALAQGSTYRAACGAASISWPTWMRWSREVRAEACDDPDIAALVADLNNRVMKRYGKSRRELFEDLDRPALIGLPADRFLHGDWSRAQVRLDYHVAVDHHDYSVPYTLAEEHVESCLTATTVEVYFKGERRAVHVRSFDYGGTTTLVEHMPASHRKYREESVADLTA